MRVSEIYASSQGEGPNVGKTTVFMRFGGCNLRCPGWPCDTQHAIDPAFRHEWEQYGVDDLTEEVMLKADEVGAELITLTGGEPFLQPNKELKPFIGNLIGKGYKVEAFSNGTIKYPNWAIQMVDFIMDWKLTGSGETRFGPRNQTRIENLKAMQLHLELWGHSLVAGDSHHAVKFVIKNEQDLQEAHTLWSLYLEKAASDVEVFYGKVWKGELSDADLVAYVMDRSLPWRLNMQTHQHIWPPDERGR